MIRPNHIAVLLMCAALMACASCSAVIKALTPSSSVITDRSDTRTTVTHMKLEGSSKLKVLLGGAVREIPISGVRLLKIDAAESMTVRGEIYYSAQVILKDGSVIVQTGQGSMQSKCFVCINNSLSGKRRDENYRIGLKDVVQVKNE
ncbi:MAG: hypothetical protein MUF22_03805 [Chitinispirillaceae bacterium]|jgi:hypothetical protein|nr:hypothetical protein [Chitinispirillaceae bacterium]